MKINLIYENVDNFNRILPNGLHPKYHVDFHSYKNMCNSFNVLTRFYPVDETSLGWFPLILKESKIHFEWKHINNIKNDEINLFVIEPNHEDISLITENVFGNISKESIKKINDNSMKLVFYYAYESFPLQQCNFMDIIKRSLIQSDINFDNFYFIFGDLNIKQNYEHYLSYHDEHFPLNYNNILTFEHFLFEQTWYYKVGYSKCNNFDKNKIKKHFLCFNGAARKQRKALITKLFRNDLEKYGYVSLLNKFDTNLYHNEWLNNDDMKFFIENKDNILEDRYLDYDDYFDESHNRDADVNLYKKSFVNIVTETLPAEPSFFITEKTIKPIANMQPFIVLGKPYTLSHLRNLGFYTFPELFNESYDNEQDNMKRFYMVFDEIKKLCNKDIKSLTNKVDYTKLEHNKNMLFNMEKYKKEVHKILDHITNETK